MAKGSGGAVTTVVFSPFEELNLKPDVALVPVEADNISKSNLSTIRYFLLQLLTYLT
jgi:hypothetical protein